MKKFSAGKARIFDISRPIAKGEPVYPGNSGPVLKRIFTFKKHGSNNSELSLGLHTATHLDAPLHSLGKGFSVDKIDLSRCMGNARVIDLMHVTQEVGIEDVKKMKPQKREILLFKTRNSLPGKRFNKNYIYLNNEAAAYLARAKVGAVGTDALGIKKFGLRPDRVHPVLLQAGVLIYEGLNLYKIQARRYFFIGLPLKIMNGEASPVRAILLQ